MNQQINKYITLFKEKMQAALKSLILRLGADRFRKLVFLVFCVILFFLSRYVAGEAISGAIYFKIALIVVIISVIYFLKRPEQLFYLFIFCLPFVEFPLVVKFDALNFANIIYAFLLFVLFFLSVIKNKITITRTYLDIPILLTIGIFLVSIVQTRYVRDVVHVIKGSFINQPYYRTLFQVILFVFIVSSAYVVVAALKDKELLKKAIRVWIYSSAFVAFLGLYGYFLAPKGFPFAAKFLTYDLIRIRGTLKEPVFYSLYLGTVIPLLYSLILNKSDIINRKLLYFCFTLNFAAMFLTRSRAGWAASILTIIIISIINIKFKSKRAKVLVIFLIVFIAAVSLTATFLVASKLASEAVQESITDIFTGQDFSATARLDATATAWAIFTQYPILGVGVGNYYFMYLRYSPFHDLIYTWNKQSQTPLINPDANNMYLTVMAETGIIGICAVLFIFLCVIINLARNIKQYKNSYWQPFLKGYLGCVIFIMIVYFFTSTLMCLFLWAMIGIIMAIQRQCGLEQRTENRGQKTEL